MLTVSDPGARRQHQLASPSLRQPMGKLQAEASQASGDDVRVGGGTGGSADSREGERHGPRACALLLATHLRKHDVVSVQTSRRGAGGALWARRRATLTCRRTLPMCLPWAM